MSAVRSKICGITRIEDALAAVEAGADAIGLVFYAKSPRAVNVLQARAIIAALPPFVTTVGLFVNASRCELNETLDAVPLDMLQLHGQETPERVAEVRARYGLPVMKAVGVADEGDLSAVFEYSLAADQLLIDAKPPKGADLPGGNGLAFDWRLVAQRRWLRPWMLAGGLTPENVAQAIRLTNARQVDVSSGVESAPGVKDPARIAAFVKAATQDGPPILR